MNTESNSNTNKPEVSKFSDFLKRYFNETIQIPVHHRQWDEKSETFITKEKYIGLTWDALAPKVQKEVKHIANSYRTNDLGNPWSESFVKVMYFLTFMGENASKDNCGDLQRCKLALYQVTQDPFCANILFPYVKDKLG